MIIRHGTLVAQASGSLGSTTFSNRAGVAICSQRPRRPNSQTPEQAAQRVAHTSAIQAWRDLTSAQRWAWNLYALRNPRLNRLNVSRRLTGFQFYMHEAVARLSAGLAAPGAPPRYGQLAIGSVSALYFDDTPLYYFEATTPTLDPHGAYLFAIHRPHSSKATKKPYWHSLPAYAVEDSAALDLSAAVIAKVGAFSPTELYMLSCRYAGNNSLVSAPATLTATVYAS